MGQKYCQINLAERRKIEKFFSAGIPAERIAEKLGRHRSTIFRELKRNFYRDPEFRKNSDYFCTIADDFARMRRAVQRKLHRHPTRGQAACKSLKSGWSPEQIAGRLTFEGHGHRVCAETIYRHIYAKDMRDEKLWQYLPERRARRRNRFGRRRYKRSRFCPEVHILKRPEAVVHRHQFGHWGKEDKKTIQRIVFPTNDLIQFRQQFGKANITSIVERVSRFSIFLKNNDRRSKPIMDQLINLLNPLPFAARRSITFDRGTEFTDWPYLQAGLGVKTWFCDPQSPWQKGTVENTNRRARRYLPRDRDPMTITNQNLKLICDGLNSTPRKCLGYKTPAEVFQEKLLEECQ